MSTTHPTPPSARWIQAQLLTWLDSHAHIQPVYPKILVCTTVAANEVGLYDNIAPVTVQWASGGADLSVAHCPPQRGVSSWS
jgi:hypothetical protein